MPITWPVHKHRDPQSLSMRVPVRRVYEPIEQMLKQRLSQRHQARFHSNHRNSMRSAAVQPVEMDPQSEYRPSQRHHIRAE